MLDNTGHSVASLWVASSSLPDSFDEWAFTDRFGLPLALYAALHRRLPSNFNQWDLADGDGWTVAHEAAMSGCLPSAHGNDDFGLWGMKNTKGLTVLDVLIDRDYDDIEEQAYMDSFRAAWSHSRPFCTREEDWLAFKAVPEIYIKYSFDQSNTTGSLLLL
jgi:hypothetical protein